MELDKLKQLVDDTFRLKQERDEIKDLLSKKNAALEVMQNEVKAILEASDLDRFDAGLGSVSVVSKSSVKVPKTEEDRDAFFAYLKDQGIFDSMITVNSRTINSWYNKEKEAAVLRGDFSFEVPGLKDVSEYTDINMRAKK